MKEQDAGGTLPVARRKRIQRLKKILVISLAVMLSVPIVLCIVIFVQINSLGKQIDELENAVVQQKNDFEIRIRELENRVKQNEIRNEERPEDEKRGRTEETDNCRKVYLTFDDGPSHNTELILDILDEYGVKATFFVVGKTDEQSLQTYRRIVDDGHTIGIHSYTHDYSEIYDSVDAYAADLKRIQDLVYETTGVLSRYTRFPGGSSNEVSKVDIRDCISYLKEQNIEYFDWNVTTMDAAHGVSDADTMAENVLHDIMKHQESTVLMHDTADKVKTVKALPGIIEGILEMEDTVILPIDDETVPVQHIK